MPHDGRARTGVSAPGASEVGTADTGSPPTGPQAATSDRALTFAGAALAAVYAPNAGDGALQLLETAGGATPEYRLPERLALSGGSAAAHAFRTDRPLWLNAAALASYPVGAPTPPRARAASLGALPLEREGIRLGCLVVVGASADGFDAGQQRFLERYADALAGLLQAESGRPATSGLLSRALRSLRVGSFVLEPDTGLIEADGTLLELVGTTADDFDGKADTLLAHALPEDMPALMSVLEPSAQTPGRRELEFRVRCPTGEMRWLSLICRVVPHTGDRPEQVLGVVTATSVKSRSADDVSRIQWLTAALDDAATVRDVGRVAVTALREPLGADRVALADVREDRLVVTLLDPPQPDAWPDLWRAQWRSEWPDAPVGALPTLQMALQDGRMDLWPAGTALEPGLAGIGAGGWPSCRSRPRAGSPGCASSGGSSRTSSSPRSGPC